MVIAHRLAARAAFASPSAGHLASVLKAHALYRDPPLLTHATPIQDSFGKTAASKRNSISCECCSTLMSLIHFSWELVSRAATITRCSQFVRALLCLVGRCCRRSGTICVACGSIIPFCRHCCPCLQMFLQPSVATLCSM